VKFKDKLLSAARANKSWLCIGLDPDPSQFPDCLAKNIDSILEFNKAIIDVTGDLVCAYKPNAAFYEVHGSRGWEILQETIRAVPGGIPVILDCKRGDIGNTAKMYAQSAFEYLGADAVTVNPYMGKDSLDPFLKYEDKGVFMLCLTSNPSSVDLQKKIVMLENPPSVEFLSPQAKAKTFAEFFNLSTVELYIYVSRLAQSWNTNDNLGLVVGATSAEELEAVRRNIGEAMPILIPGVGAQGGDLEKSVEYGSNREGELALINIARGVIYAGNGEKYKSNIRRAAEKYRDNINKAVSRKIQIR
jgi:orotidine-5'-phosphate decarboxylase